MLRERVPLLRGLAAPPDPDFAAGDFRAVEPPVEDLARDDVDFFAVLRFAVELFVDDLRPPLLRDELLPREAEPLELEPELALALPSIVHLPDMTRCAASATASAMSEPSLVALDITLLAACVAVSAASRPASRIALRAFGLALIAAAAAARPAASISLLIAALASLSTVLSLPREDEPEELFPEDLLRAALAIAPSPLFRGKDTYEP